MPLEGRCLEPSAVVLGAASSAASALMGTRRRSTSGSTTDRIGVCFAASEMAMGDPGCG
jgi:hypothetical protein